jgi:hypothetical protein
MRPRTRFRKPVRRQCMHTWMVREQPFIASMKVISSVTCTRPNTRSRQHHARFDSAHTFRYIGDVLITLAKLSGGGLVRYEVALRLAQT